METGQISRLNKLLIDTSLLIAVLRGNRKIGEYLNGLTRQAQLFISVITLIEIYVGAISVRHEREAQELLVNFEVVTVDENVAKEAVALIKNYPSIFGKAASRGTADALIAASAISIKAKLVTLNSRHFEKIAKDDLEVEIVS